MDGVWSGKGLDEGRTCENGSWPMLVVAASHGHDVCVPVDVGGLLLIIKFQVERVSDQQ